MIPKKILYNLHYDDVRGDLRWKGDNTQNIISGFIIKSLEIVSTYLLQIYESFGIKKRQNAQNNVKQYLLISKAINNSE